MDGIRLDHLDPDTVHEVSPAIGVWLMAEGYAVLEMRNPSRSDRRSSSASFASIGSIGGVIAKRPRCAGVDTPGSGFFRSALMMRDSKSRVQVLESAVPQNIANLLTQLNEAAGTGIDVASFWQQHASRQIRRS